MDNGLGTAQPPMFGDSPKAIPNLSLIARMLPCGIAPSFQAIILSSNNACGH